MKKSQKTFRLISVILAVTLALAALTITIFAAIEETAQSFIEAVELIESTTNLEEQETYLELAENLWQVYTDEGGSSEDEIIAEHYEKYMDSKEIIEQKVAYCIEFIQYVEAANEAEDYPTIKANLIKAEELINKIDSDYVGVQSAKTTYSNLCKTLSEPEGLCEMYIEKAAAAAEANTYYDANYILTEAKRLKANITIEDYPGLDEADENIKKTEKFLAARLLEAAPFIIAVRNISLAENVPAGVMAAYEALKGIDQTTDGVSSALSDLKKTEKEYNQKAQIANEAASEAESVVFAFIF